MREVQRTEITIMGTQWCVERLDGTVLAAKRVRDQVRGGDDNKQLETSVHERIFLRDAQGAEHVLRIRLADAGGREGHHLVILWIKPMLMANSAANGVEEDLGGDTSFLILMYDRDTDEANWKGGKGMRAVYPLTDNMIRGIGGLAFLTLATLGWSIKPALSLALLGLYLVPVSMQEIAARALRARLLPMAKAPLPTASP